MHTQLERARIQIMKVPAGEAPFEVREAWVGLVLECDPYVGYPDSGFERGVVTDKEAPHNRRGFSVDQSFALMILGQNRPHAAAWWREHNYPHHGQCFGFAEDEVRVISGVIQHRITYVTGEMQGDPNR